jgi:hypothetical protein
MEIYGRGFAVALDYQTFHQHVEEYRRFRMRT